VEEVALGNGDLMAGIGPGVRRSLRRASLMGKNLPLLSGETVGPWGRGGATVLRGREGGGCLGGEGGGEGALVIWGGQWKVGREWREGEGKGRVVYGGIVWDYESRIEKYMYRAYHKGTKKEFHLYSKTLTDRALSHLNSLLQIQASTQKKGWLNNFAPPAEAGF